MSPYRLTLCFRHGPPIHLGVDTVPEALELARRHLTNPQPDPASRFSGFGTMTKVILERSDWLETPAPDLEQTHATIRTPSP